MNTNFDRNNDAYIDKNAGEYFGIAGLILGIVGLLCGSYILYWAIATKIFMAKTFFLAFLLSAAPFAILHIVTIASSIIAFVFGIISKKQGYINYISKYSVALGVVAMIVYTFAHAIM